MSITPVPLNVLGEALRDGAWVDIRCIDGEEFLTLERVQVLTIVIYRDYELIEVRQQWQDGDVHDETFYVECDSIRWLKPTSFDLVAVTPHDNVVTRAKSAKLDAAWDAVCAVLGQVAYLKPGDFAKRINANAYREHGVEPLNTHMRYLALLLLYEVTEAAPLDLCRMIGYHSIQPLLSARDKFKRSDDLRAELEKRMAQVMHRVHSYERRSGERRYSPLEK